MQGVGEGCGKHHFCAVTRDRIWKRMGAVYVSKTCMSVWSGECISGLLEQGHSSHAT